MSGGFGNGAGSSQWAMACPQRACLGFGPAYAAAELKDGGAFPPVHPVRGGPSSPVLTRALPRYRNDLHAIARESKSSLAAKRAEPSLGCSFKSS
jgi:hypothetical protein